MHPDKGELSHYSNWMKAVYNVWQHHHLCCVPGSVPWADLIVDVLTPTYLTWEIMAMNTRQFKDSTALRAETAPFNWDALGHGVRCQISCSIARSPPTLWEWVLYRLLPLTSPCKTASLGWYPLWCVVVTVTSVLGVKRSRLYYWDAWQSLYCHLAFLPPAYNSSFSHLW